MITLDQKIFKISKKIAKQMKTTIIQGPPSVILPENQWLIPNKGCQVTLSELVFLTLKEYIHHSVKRADVDFQCMPDLAQVFNSLSPTVGGKGEQDLANQERVILLNEVQSQRNEILRMIKIDIYNLGVNSAMSVFEKMLKTDNFFKLACKKLSRISQSAGFDLETQRYDLLICMPQLSALFSAALQGRPSNYLQRIVPQRNNLPLQQETINLEATSTVPSNPMPFCFNEQLILLIKNIFNPELSPNEIRKQLHDEIKKKLSVGSGTHSYCFTAGFIFALVMKKCLDDGRVLTPTVCDNFPDVLKKKLGARHKLLTPGGDFYLSSTASPMKKLIESVFDSLLLSLTPLSRAAAEPQEKSKSTPPTPISRFKKRMSFFRPRKRSTGDPSEASTSDSSGSSAKKP